MSNDLNSCNFIGRLGADPEVRFMGNGKAVANIRIAVGSSWKDKDSGDLKESVEWVPVVFYDKLAEIVGDYLRKGSQIFVSGRFKTRKWQAKDGSDRYSTEIIANQMQMLGGKRQEQERTERSEPKREERIENPTDDFGDSEIPF